MANNKGYEFESILGRVNELYRRQNKAIIDKRPTPMVIIRKMAQGFLCRFDKKKSTVDYDGVYKSKSIRFEAKSMTKKLKSLPLDYFKEHQIEYLIDCRSHGCICFLLLFLPEQDKLYLMDINVLEKAVEDAKEIGRKSIPLTTFEESAHLVTNLDYLKVVDKLYFEETEL